MIEVFKTNVASQHDAQQILSGYHIFFPHWKINFDLDDCDKILRIDSGGDVIQIGEVKRVLTTFGYTAEVLPN